jgi:flavin-dependent thymidylate synthase
MEVQMTYQIELIEGIIDDGLTKDVAFNRKSFGLPGHVSPYDQALIFVGLSDIDVRLVQGINEDDFRRTLSRAINATSGVDLSNPPDEGDWEEMLKGGLQTALETQTIVFEVSGVTRTATHQIVRSRRASFHQQSQRASFMGYEPNVRMPKSVYNNERARLAFEAAAEASAHAYRVAVSEDISYQDARFALLEGTTTYILCEYPVREFLALYAYRACSMFQWEICHTVREMGRVLTERYPWLAPYVKISCEKTHGALDAIPSTTVEFGDHKMAVTDDPEATAHTCTFQGWEEVDEQCDFPWARETNRQFRSDRHVIRKTCVQHQYLDQEGKI